MKTLFVLLHLLATVRAYTTESCEAACTELMRTSVEVHRGMMEACKKQNQVPRPVVMEICQSTWKAVRQSSCVRECDGGITQLEEDVCGSIVQTTWISKTQAYKSCRAGYKGAEMMIPPIFQNAKDSAPIVGLLAEPEPDPEESPVPAEPAAPAEPVEEPSADDPEVTFPITIDNGRTVDLKMRVKSEDPKARVSAFCAEYMNDPSACEDQLLPVILAKIKSLDSSEPELKPVEHSATPPADPEEDTEEESVD